MSKSIQTSVFARTRFTFISTPKFALRLPLPAIKHANIATTPATASPMPSSATLLQPRFLGRWDDNRNQEIDKARKVAHGHFLWFSHDGKAYIVDDPQIVTQLEAMQKPMDDLRDQMHALGDQMHALGEQQRELGKQMRDISVPTPDLTKEMDELNAAVAALKAKQGGTISQRDLADLQRDFGRIQGELGGLQGKIGAQQEALGGNMGKFGRQMGELGGQMGKLGAQMGQIDRENRDKTEKVIDESLKDGKARPVE